MPAFAGIYIGENMEITNIKLKDNIPDEVTIAMSVDNLASLTKLLGKLSHADLISRDCGDCVQSSHELHDLFTGDFFNRFWDDGIVDYLRSRNG
jgi:hypothetical protein